MYQDVSEIDSGGCVANTVKQGGVAFSQSRESLADNLKLALKDDLQIFLGKIPIL